MSFRSSFQKIESQFTDVRFARVDSDTLDQLINKDESVDSVLSEDQIEKVKEQRPDWIEESVNVGKYYAIFRSLKEVLKLELLKPVSMIGQLT